MPSYERVKNYILNAYPIYIDTKDIDDILKMTLNKVGNKINKNIFKSFVMTHLFNKALLFDESIIHGLSMQETEFMKM